MIRGLTFAHPWILLLLAVIPLIVVWYIIRHKRMKAPLHIGTTAMFAGVGNTMRVTLYHARFALRCAALALLVIALARPQSKLKYEEMEIEGIDIVLAMDVSGSMMAEDFRPNRLEAAKEVAKEFIEGRRNDRIALVEFAGEAFTQTPLTIDHNVLQRQLKDMKTGLLDDGTAIGDGLATSINRLRESEAVSKVVILLTDGVNNRGAIDPETAAELCSEYGIRLYTIGVGGHGTARFHDEYGRPFQAEVDLDEKLLTRMADCTDGGHYYHANNKQALKEIFNDIDKAERTRMEVTQYRQTKEEFKLFLIAALLLLGLEMLLRLDK